MDVTSNGLKAALSGALVTALLLAPPAARAQTSDQTPEVSLGADARQSVGLTVYSGDLALVDEVRRVTLPVGRSRVALGDIGTGLRPETAILGGPDLRILERVFAFDLLTPQRLLEAAVGSKVRVVRTHPETGAEEVLEAELLAIAGGPVLRIGDRIETAEPGRIVFDQLPPGLRERPTLLAEIEAGRAGPHDLSLSYLTGGLTWRADYVARLDQSGTRLDLTGLVTIANNSDANFEDASLRLVAGVVNQAGPAPRPKVARMVAMESMAAADMPAQEAASDRYVYSYDRPVDLAKRETKQLTLLEAGGVAVARRYRFEELIAAHEGADEIGPVQAAIVLEVENTAAAGLGRPLPGGVVRVYEAAAGGALFSGEDTIPHTPEGETLKLTLGRAFDVTGTARTTAFERISNRSYESAQEIELANAKDEAVEVKVVGHMPPGWKMLSESLAHEAETANRIAWTVQVPAKGQAKFSYRVRVSR